MTRIGKVVLPLLLVGAFAAVLRADLRVRPPEFESDHPLPGTEAPPARDAVWHYADVAVLLGALTMAGYLALHRRSRPWLVVLTVFSLAYFGFWRGGCVCPVGSVQNVALALFDSSYALPLAVLAFFLIPLVFTLFHGRTFCAAVCPLGAVQDLVVLKPLHLPRWLADSLGLLPYVYLAVAVLMAAMGSAFVICRIDPFVSLFRLVPLGQWAHGLSQGQSPPGGTLAIAGRFDMLLLAATFLLLGTVVARPYCRFLCPYGAILRLFSRISKLHVTITPGECVKCRLCEDSCPFGAIRKPAGQVPASLRQSEKKRLAVFLALLPVLVFLGGLLGHASAGQVARMDYTVRLAERIRLEETGLVTDQTDQSKAFSATGQTYRQLYSRALTIKNRYDIGTSLVGAFVGLVIGLKLVSLTVKRKREDYLPDKATCLSCGRCFAYCPIEHQRRIKGTLPKIVRTDQ